MEQPFASKFYLTYLLKKKFKINTNCRVQWKNFKKKIQIDKIMSTKNTKKEMIRIYLYISKQ